MGTSSSFGGPGDTSYLLPTRARPNNDTIDSPTDVGTQPDGDNQNIEPSVSENPDSTKKEDHGDTSPQTTWKAAKSIMSRFASGGSRISSPAKAGKSYVSAKGGAKRAAQAAISGRATARTLANFFATTAKSNIAGGLNLIGLGHLIGKDIDAVFSGLIDTIASSGEDFDKNIARQAMGDALESFYTQCSIDQNFNSMEHLEAVHVQNVIEEFVAGYIYKRWLQELGFRIEKKAVTENEAIKLETEVKIYVRDSVKLELDSKNPLLIDWNGAEGHQIIDSLYEEAYSLIEEGGE